MQGKYKKMPRRKQNARKVPENATDMPEYL
jgi:hypothetical protein